MDEHKCEKVEKKKKEKKSNQQNLAIPLVNKKCIFSYSRNLLISDNILNAYQLHILRFTTYMHNKVPSETNPRLFRSEFEKPEHK